MQTVYLYFETQTDIRKDSEKCEEKEDQLEKDCKTKRRIQ